MSSFLNDAVNFITNGKVTVRTLSQLGMINAGQCVIPNQFYESGWGLWLPMPNVTLLPFLSYCVANNFNRTEIIQFLEMKNKPKSIFDFNSDFKRELELDDGYEMLYAREIEIKRRLEANGYQYPKDINDVLNLYIALGLVYEISNSNEEGFMDMIIRPLKKIDEILTVQ